MFDNRPPRKDLSSPECIVLLSGIAEGILPMTQDAKTLREAFAFIASADLLWEAFELKRQAAEAALKTVDPQILRNILGIVDDKGRAQ